MKIFFGILFAFVFTVLVLFVYLGGFSQVVVEEKQIGPYFLIYESNKGSYRQTGESVKKLIEHAKQQGVTVEAGFGYYIDDPNTVPEADLRSEAGVMVSAADFARLSTLDQFKSRTFDTQQAAVAEFPLKNFLSILLGIWKVYPKLVDYLKEKNYVAGPAFEIYKIEEKKTIYALLFSR